MSPLSKKIQVIPQVRDYFGTPEVPIITQEFIPGKGWKSTNYKKRVSRSWLRKLKREGVTHVSLLISSDNAQIAGRSADFSVEELLKVDRTPLLGGNLI